MWVTEMPGGEQLVHKLTEVQVLQALVLERTTW